MSQEWKKPETVWGLVPRLNFIRETTQAILFENKDQDELWIPKSQIHFTYWVVSKYFVPISKWLLNKKRLGAFAYIIDSQITRDWILLQDTFFEERLQIREPPQIPLFQKPLTASDILRETDTPTPKEWRPLLTREIEAQRQLMLDQEVNDFQARLKKAQTRREMPTPKRGRAMNLHLDQDEE